MKLTKIEHNVLMVALDHMEEHLNDLREDLDCYEDEFINMQRLLAVKEIAFKFKKEESVKLSYKAQVDYIQEVLETAPLKSIPTKTLYQVVMDIIIENKV